MTASNRNLTASIGRTFAEDVDRWAVIVGISKYKHERLNLRFAHRDAEELCKLIQTPSGGNFKPDQILKLVDEEATTANITRALHSYLKKPAREDLVLIYFACHGQPDKAQQGAAPGMPA